MGLFTMNLKAKVIWTFGYFTIQPEYQRNYIYADGKEMLQLLNHFKRLSIRFNLFQ
jgi:hypothetical protein